MLKVREKGGDLSQSYDKSLYTIRKFKSPEHKDATKNFDYLMIVDQLRTV